MSQSGIQWSSLVEHRFVEIIDRLKFLRFSGAESPAMRFSATHDT
jgi:hypothetical protein